ncbi:MAG: hypothetical protein ACRES6_08970 [Steroidobacteraceae bacterium]
MALGISRAEVDTLTLDRTERSAFAIVFSELEGNEFDWGAMCFKKRK